MSPVPEAQPIEGFGLPYWLDLPRPSFGTLEAPAKADVAIVGAGIAGLKLARCLSRLGLSSVICEGAQVGQGASARNQGSINQGADQVYGECVKKFGREASREYWRLGEENHRLIREQMAEHGIACDYQREGMTTLVRRDFPGWEDRLAAYRADYDLLREDGFDATWLDEGEATRAGSGPAGIYAGGLRYNGDAQFHSGKYVIGLAQAVARLRGVRICEGVRVHRIVRAGPAAVRLETSAHPVDASAVFLATNALAPQFIPSLERPLRAERGQVLVTAPLPDRPCRGSFGTTMAWWREVVLPDGKFRLLFGGGRDREAPDSLFPQFRADGSPHPLLEKNGFSPSRGHQGRLDAQLAILFPRYRGVAITHRWGGLQSFTVDHFPFIGCLDQERRIYGMVGLCGRGNHHSEVGAEYLAGKLAGVVTPVEARFGPLFARFTPPHRPSARWGEWKSEVGI